MAKRRVFHVSTGVFELGLSATAISCLYNAPVDFNTDMAAFKAAL